jgi:hypothetical protein
MQSIQEIKAALFGGLLPGPKRPTFRPTIENQKFLSH